MNTMTEIGDVQMLCQMCKKNLAGLRYVLHESKPYCVVCYEGNFSHKCEACHSIIGTDCKDLAYKDRHWHDRCFFCCICKTSLVDKPFAFKDEKIYCAECHEKYNATKCDVCQKIFKAGMKKYEYSGRQWHEECFKCQECHSFIGSNSFILQDDYPVCVPCYENKYALRCTKCKGVINKGGLKCKDSPFHKECFCCTNCNKPLGAEKYTMRDDKPHCIDCFGALFAKKCCKCERPITGIGGSKYIAFEERNWHSDCFNCQKCGKNLVGKGFLTNGNDILCPTCGKM